MSELRLTGGSGGGLQARPANGWYIDDKGMLWDEDSRQLRQSVIIEPDIDFCDYVVRNLGFVHVFCRGMSFGARLKPGTLAPQALASLIHLLSEQKVERIAVTYHMAGWEHAMFGSLFAAMRGLVELVNTANPASLQFLSRTIPVETLAPGTALSELLLVWERMQSSFDRERLDGLLAGGLAGRFVIVEAAARTSGFRLAEVGSGLARQASYWLSRSVGLAVADQPDVRYGRWVTSSYSAVMRDGRPRLEAVDAVIRWPDVGPSRHCYRRLLLPFGGDGAAGAVLLSAPVRDGAIDLRCETC